MAAMKTQLTNIALRRCQFTPTPSRFIQIRKAATSRHRVPPENGPHLCTLMAYPSAKSLPDPQVLAEARRDVVRIASAVARFEPVVLFASAGAALESARKDVEQAAIKSSIKPASTQQDDTGEIHGHSIIVKEMSLDELWIRDTGPIFAIAPDSKGAPLQHLVGIDLNFNNWGAKLDPLGPDYFDFSLAERIVADSSQWMAPASKFFHQQRPVPASKYHKLSRSWELTKHYRSRLTAEGGNIEISCDGKTLLIVRAAIVNANRNPGCDMAFISSKLKEDLGVESIIWLDGAEGTDITDTHVDALARFVPGPLERRNDVSHVVLSRPTCSGLEARLKAYRSAKITLQTYHAPASSPKRFVIHELQEPNMDPTEEAYNETFSYANFYLVNNNGLLLPQFGGEASETDQKAYETICDVFAPRQVVQVQLDVLPRIGGGIHCATQQVPLVF